MAFELLLRVFISFCEQFKISVLLLPYSSEQVVSRSNSRWALSLNSAREKWLNSAKWLLIEHSHLAPAKHGGNFLKLISRQEMIWTSVNSHQCNKLNGIWHMEQNLGSEFSMFVFGTSFDVFLFLKYRVILFWPFSIINWSFFFFRDFLTSSVFFPFTTRRKILCNIWVKLSPPVKQTRPKLSSEIT